MSSTASTTSYHDRTARLRTTPCEFDHDPARPADAIWRTRAHRSPLCWPCVSLWWGFAQEYPDNLPEDIVPLLPSPCRCGHSRDRHTHLRRGLDCSACDCTRYRRTRLGWVSDMITKWFGR